MRCRKIQKRLPQYVQGGLSEAEAGRVREHVHRCPACRDSEQDLRSVWEALGSLPEPDASGTMLPYVLRRIDDYEQSRSGSLAGWFLLRRRPSLAGAAAVVMLLGFISGLFFAALQPLSAFDPATPDEPDYTDIVSDTQSASFFDAYLQITGTAVEENSL